MLRAVEKDRQAKWERKRRVNGFTRWLLKGIWPWGKDFTPGYGFRKNRRQKTA